MPTLTHDQLAALGRTNAGNRQIEATLGRAMTPDERGVVDRARVLWRLSREAKRHKDKLGSSDRHTQITAERSKVDRVPCADPARRARLEADPVAWLRHYLSETYSRPFEKPHIEIVSGVMRAHETRGRFVVAAERGIGKSAILWGMILFLALSGRQRYPVCVPWADKALKRAFRFWKSALCFNDRLGADYPEFCAPFRHSRGVAQRVMTTTWRDTGEPCGCQLTVGEGMIVLPARLGCIGGSTINGNIRGLNHPQDDGTVLRPSIVLLDDVQDRQTAKSPVQVADTCAIIDGDVGGCGDPGRDMPMLMACNCIAPGDVSEHYLANPEWHALRIPCIEAWPSGWDDTMSACRKLWGEWHELFLSGKGDRTFYRKHKRTLTKGMRLSAPAAFKGAEKCPDAYYGAVRMYFRMGHDAFMAERQQAPVNPMESSESRYELTVENVIGHTVDTPRLNLPPASTVFTGHIDVNRVGLHWCLASFDQQMTAHVVAYGKYPARGDLWPENAPDRIKQVAIFGGLAKLCDQLAGTTFDHDGRSVYPGLVLVDASYESDTIHRFAENAHYRFRLHPAIGRAAHRYRWSKATLVGRPGQECHLQRPQSRRCPYAMFNADHWREVMQRAFLGTPGEPGGCTLHAVGHRRAHVPFAEHIVAERIANKYETDIGWRWEWTHRPGVSWDWADTLTGCWVGAALQGLSTSGIRVIRRVRRNKAAVSWAKVGRS